MSFSLPVHLLRQHLFCPRVPWFQELLDFRPPQPAWVQQGVAFHTRQKAAFRYRTLKRFGLEKAKKIFHLSVRSARWGMHGIVDCVLETDTETFAVEIKLADGKPTRGHLVQVAAYGLLLRDTLGKISSTAFVVTGKTGKTWPVPLTEQRIEEVTRIRDEICQNLERARFPDSSATAAQCTQCEYLNYCNDR